MSDAGSRGYEIIREIGRGGFATVFLARQAGLDRMVALKRFEDGNGIDSKLARRFGREARAIGRLSDPNIVGVYDHFVEDDVLYISMEYLPGGSLRRYMGLNLTTAQIGGVLTGVLKGLAHADQHQLVHRDLKPENLLVSAAGTIKIADFGIAKASEPLFSRDLVSHGGGLLGTPRYMAPEQATQGDIGPWTDLYAVGLIAWELWVGKRPFPAFDDPLAQLYHQIHNPVPRAEGVATAYADWIERLVKNEPSERTQSPGTALEELDELLTEELGLRWDRRSALPEIAVAAPVSDQRPHRVVNGTTTSSSPPPVEEPEEPPAEPVETAEPGGRRFPVRAALYTSAAALAVTAVVLAIVLPSSAKDPQKPSGAAAAAGTPTATPTPLPLAAGDLRASAGSTWRVVDDAPELTGMKLASQVAAAPKGRSEDGAVVIGMAPKSANNRQLLPSEFLASLGLRSGPERERVELGDELAAYHYAALRPAKLRRSVDVYAAPTSAGVATVACIAPETVSAEFATACDAVARSLHPSESAKLSAAALGPDPDFAKDVNSVLAQLAQTKRSGHKALGSATTDQKAYRAAAGKVADGFRTARRAILALDPSPADSTVTAELATKLQAATTAYRKLSTTASRENAQTSAKTADAAEVAAKAADKALGRLITNGYAGRIHPRIPATSVPHIEPMPVVNTRSSSNDAGTGSGTTTTPSSTTGPVHGDS